MRAQVLAPILICTRPSGRTVVTGPWDTPWRFRPVSRALWHLDAHLLRTEPQSPSRGQKAPPLSCEAVFSPASPQWAGALRAGGSYHLGRGDRRSSVCARSDVKVEGGLSV